MEKLEHIVLDLLNQGYVINDIIKKIDIEDVILADIIVDLDEKGLIVLKEKKWALTEKGKDIFKKRNESIKKLKIEYMFGDIKNKDEYNKRIKELEDISKIISTVSEIIEKPQNLKLEEEIIPSKTVNISEIVSDFKNKGDTSEKICPKCNIENKPESNYCRKCGTTLKDQSQ